MVVLAYNPSMWEVEAGGSWVLANFGLHSTTLSQKKKKKTRKGEKDDKNNKHKTKHQYKD
jgi:hypothetical protein